MSFKKIAITVSAAALSITGLAYFFRLKRTSEQLETYATLNVFKLSFKELVVLVDVKLKNPTGTKFTIKFPFVKLIYKGVTVGSSQVVNRDIVIPDYGEAVAEKIMIPVELKEEVSLGIELITSLLAGEGVKFSVTKITTIDGKIPYEKTEEVILKKSK